MEQAQRRLNAWPKRSFVALCLTLISLSANASLTPEIVNGSFSVSVAPGTELPPVAPGWEVANSTPEVVGETAPTNNTGIPWVLSPDGGTFAKLNGTLDPTFREAISQSIDGFVVGQTYQLEFHHVNLGWYFPTLNEWNDTPGFIEFYLDDVLVATSPALNAPSARDVPIVWSDHHFTFTATAETHTLRIEANTTATEPDPRGSSRYTTAYMAIDGVRLTSEICGNGIDDDFDGLVDAEDEDCIPPTPPVDLLVRCLHKPLYPAEGEPMQIIAEAIDGTGQAIEADEINIYVNRQDEAYATGIGAELTARVTEVGENPYYGCEAKVGDSQAFSGMRNVDAGAPVNPDWAAIPIFYNGKIDEKIDIIFIAEEDAFPGGPLVNSNFKDTLYDMIREGLFYIPWFVRNQSAFNLWVARDVAGVLPKNSDNPSSVCKKRKPPKFKSKYGFGDAIGIIHGEACRDTSSLKTFSTKYADPTRYQVLAHEIGHAAFSLSDEYEPNRGQTFYFTLPDVPNVFPTQVGCLNGAVRRNKDPDACRAINGGIAGLWWIFEPDYYVPDDRTTEVGDLMQQTGYDRCFPTSQSFCHRVRVGDSEIDRMNWKVNKCTNGKC